MDLTPMWEQLQGMLDYTLVLIPNLIVALPPQRRGKQITRESLAESDAPADAGTRRRGDMMEVRDDTVSDAI